MRTRFVPVVAALLLWGTFFLKFQILLFAGLGLCAGGFTLYLANRFLIDRVGAVVIINYLYWLVSGFIVRSVSMTDLMNIDFYQGDGRIFLYYIPLLAFSLYTAKERDLEMTRKSLVWLAIGFIILFGVWAPTHIGILSGGPPESLFVGFLTHHTGSGMYAAFISVFLVIYGSENKRKFYRLLGVVCLLPVIGAGSRETFVAIFAAFGWYFVRRVKLSSILTVGVLSVFLIGIVPFIAPQVYGRTAELFSSSVVKAAWKTLWSVKWKPGDVKDPEEEGPTNILMRIIYWVYATQRFSESPIVGVGWGRFNDVNVRMVGVKHVLYLGTSGQKVWTTLNAHNSCLHLLAESGVVGLGLLAWLWWTIYFRLKRMADFFSEDPLRRGFYAGCQGVVILILFASLTGHAVAAPSTGIPALTVIGLALSYQRRVAKEAAAESASLAAAPA